MQIVTYVIGDFTKKFTKKFNFYEFTHPTGFCTMAFEFLAEETLQIYFDK